MNDSAFLIIALTFAIGFILGFQRRLRVRRLGAALLIASPWIIFFTTAAQDGCFVPDVDRCMLGWGVMMGGLMWIPWVGVVLLGIYCGRRAGG